MKKIQFRVINDNLIITEYIENNPIKNLNNTNIINDDDLIFDYKYVKNNLSLVAGFLNVLLRNGKIKTAILESENIIDLVFDLLDNIPVITELTIKPDIVIDYNMHFKILKNDTLKVINCYTIPGYVLERIDTTKRIKINTRSEVFFISNFVKLNKLNSYSDIFYKRKLELNYSFTDTDWSDFENFLSINTYLKLLSFDVITPDLIGKVLDLLKKYDKTNILISIKGTSDNLSDFNTLESIVKKNKYVKKANIKFRIDYTREYKLENFMKLLNFTSLRYIFVVVIISCIAGYGINKYNLYQSSKEVDNISTSIESLLEEFEQFDIPSESTGEESIQESTSSSTKPTYVSPYYRNYSKVLSVLKESNPDTVGWVTVPNTTVNYPVVQSTNNSFYLTHDFYKNANSFGWIFMDYRNNAAELDQNTVIYGHNLSGGYIMFGDLSRTLTPAWYNNSANQVISFNTASGEMNWRIFSIYKIDPTNDYLYNTFNTQEEFIMFTNKLAARSVKDFGVQINPNDKIITLSTCQGGGKYRLVVHAVLID